MPTTDPAILPEQFFKTLLDSIFDAVYTVNTDGIITYWNASCTRITGFTADELIGRHYLQCGFAFLSRGDLDPADPITLNSRSGIQIALETGVAGTWKGFIKRKNGQRLPIESHIAPLRDADGQTIGAVEVFRDISAQVALEGAHAEVIRTARRDQLTGLYNRAATTELLKAEIARSQRYDQPLSLVMIDLDHFKAVNDNHGHDIGDRLLIEVGALLTNNLRKPDAAGRWGGEEFLVLAPGSDAKAAAALAERIRRYINEIELTNPTVSATASLGVSQYHPGQHRDELIRQADQALYQAKQSGRDQVVTAPPLEQP